MNDKEDGREPIIIYVDREVTQNGGRPESFDPAFCQQT